MKPTTFIDYIVAEHETLMDGWYSGAAFEGSVQVVFDRIFRRHLSNKVAFLEPEPDGEVHYDPVALVQRSGRFATTVLPQGLYIRDIAQDAWPTQREIKYDGLTTIADLKVTNKRAATGGADDLSIRLKQTYYWIEIKVESPSTHNFGGKSLATAFNEDAGKLLLQKQNDAHNPGERRRYWFVMLAFSDGQCGAMKTLQNAGWTATRDAQVERGTFTICLKEM